jgi:hypothetical protein
MEKETMYITIRMSKELHAWLKDYAARKRRSINSQCLEILEEEQRRDMAEQSGPAEDQKEKP